MAINPRTFAPIVSLAATWVVRKGMTKAYERRTGDTPPDREDLATPLRTVILWAMLTALSTALIDVLIQRGAAELERRQELAAGDA